MATLAGLRRYFLEKYLRDHYRLLTSANGTIAGTATTVTSTELADANISTTFWKGAIIHRPDAATAADKERRVNSVTGTASVATFTHTGVNYADTTFSNEAVELIKLYGEMRLADLTNLINSALTECYFEDFIPIGNMVTDGDMRASGVADWTSSASATDSKVATAGKVWQNTQALRVLNAAANQYTESAAIKVGRSLALRVFTTQMVDVGSCEITLFDATNSVALHAAETCTYKGFSAYLRPFQTGNTTDSLSLRLGGSGASDDVYYSHAVVWDPSDRYATLPSFIQYADQVRGFYAIVPTQVANNTNHFYRADSITRVPVEGYVDIQPGFGTPNRAFFPRGLGNYPVFADVVRPAVVTNSTELAAETDAVPISEDYAAPFIAAEFYRRLMQHGYSADGDTVAFDMEHLRQADAYARREASKYKPRGVRRTVSVWSGAEGFG